MHNYSVKRRKVIKEFLLAGLLAILPMGGSDSPTPYTLTNEGIQLPAGVTFQDNGHVNVETTKGTVNVHFEGKCGTDKPDGCSADRIASAKYIGKGFIPWTVFNINIEETCVTWVQISNFNEHYGEGDQSGFGGGCDAPPVGPTPTPTEEPTVKPSETPTSEPSKQGATETPSVTPITTTSVETPSLSPKTKEPQPTGEPGETVLASTGLDIVSYVIITVFLLVSGGVLVYVYKREDK